MVSLIENKSLWCIPKVLLTMRMYLSPQSPFYSYSHATSLVLFFNHSVAFYTSYHHEESRYKCVRIYMYIYVGIKSFDISR
jgi:hypothetical protein